MRDASAMARMERSLRAAFAAHPVPDSAPGFAKRTARAAAARRRRPGIAPALLAAAVAVAAIAVAAIRPPDTPPDTSRRRAAAAADIREPHLAGPQAQLPARPAERAEPSATPKSPWDRLADILAQARAVARQAPAPPARPRPRRQRSQPPDLPPIGACGNDPICPLMPRKTHLKPGTGSPP
jgi:hypothetical protein